MKKAHVYEGNLEYSSLMPNPERWVKAADYDAAEARIRELEARIRLLEENNAVYRSLAAQATARAVELLPVGSPLSDATQNRKGEP
jgi:hypothetical protein